MPVYNPLVLPPDVPDIDEVHVLRVERGDALIFRSPRVLTKEKVEHIGTRLKNWAREHFGFEVPCLVLEEGASIEVLRATELGHNVVSLEESK